MRLAYRGRAEADFALSEEYDALLQSVGGVANLRGLAGGGVGSDGARALSQESLLQLLEKFNLTSILNG